MAAILHAALVLGGLALLGTTCAEGSTEGWGRPLNAEEFYGEAGQPELVLSASGVPKGCWA